jgi:hypothetical protein
MEKELLSIYEMLEKFLSMLLGAAINIFTNHKNLTYSSTVNQRLIWQLYYLEDFSPIFHQKHYHHIPVRTIPSQCF